MKLSHSPGVSVFPDITRGMYMYPPFWWMFMDAQLQTQREMKVVLTVKVSTQSHCEENKTVSTYGKNDAESQDLVWWQSLSNSGDPSWSSSLLAWTYFEKNICFWLWILKLFSRISSFDVTPCANQPISISSLPFGATWPLYTELHMYTSCDWLRTWEPDGLNPPLKEKMICNFPIICTRTDAHRVCF